MNKPEHFFLSESGHLFDTRRPGWSQGEPLRPMHSYHHREIRTGLELRQTLRAGSVTFPGCYTVVLITSDGELVSIDGLLQDRGALYRALWDIRTGAHGRIIMCDTYDEGPPVECAYTGRMIESSYGDPDSDESTNG